MLLRVYKSLWPPGIWNSLMFKLNGLICHGDYTTAATPFNGLAIRRLKIKMRESRYQLPAPTR